MLESDKVILAGLLVSWHLRQGEYLWFIHRCYC